MEFKPPASTLNRRPGPRPLRGHGSGLSQPPGRQPHPLNESQCPGNPGARPQRGLQDAKGHGDRCLIARVFPAARGCETAGNQGASTRARPPGMDTRPDGLLPLPDASSTASRPPTPPADGFRRHPPPNSALGGAGSAFSGRHPPPGPHRQGYRNTPAQDHNRRAALRLSPPLDEDRILAAIKLETSRQEAGNAWEEGNGEPNTRTGLPPGTDRAGLAAQGWRHRTGGTGRGPICPDPPLVSGRACPPGFREPSWRRPPLRPAPWRQAFHAEMDEGRRNRTGTDTEAPPGDTQGYRPHSWLQPVRKPDTPEGASRRFPETGSRDLREPRASRRTRRTRRRIGLRRRPGTAGPWRTVSFAIRVG
jgi:hypothetical protein